MIIDVEISGVMRFSQAPYDSLVYAHHSCGPGALNSESFRVEKEETARDKNWGLKSNKTYMH